ncbi:MAG: hypothetical protein NVS2B12_14340 [Ktedonobacteraceae bacterium]
MRTIYRRLKECNIEPWFDEENLLPGETWEQIIPGVIPRCDIVLICLSMAFLNKERYGHYEIRLILEAAKRQPIGTIFHIPFRLDDCEVPDYLGDRHYISNSVPGDFEKLMAAFEKRREALNRMHGANIEPLRAASSFLPEHLNTSGDTRGATNLAQKSVDVAISTTDEAIRDGIARRIKTILAANALVDHTQLFGVDDIILDVGNALSAPAGNWIISVFGEGGVGKTALIYEVVSRYAVQAGFTRLAWVSAKNIHISLDGMVVKTSSEKFRWINLIKNIADQLEISLGYNSTLWMADFQHSIRSQSPSEKYLLVIDNLETVEDVDEAIYYLGGEQIVKPHKILVTTRHALLGKALSIVEKHLIGLKLTIALDFIRSIGNTDIQQAADQELALIVEATEGNPLLMKLFVKRFLTSHLPLHMVLAELQTVHKRFGKSIVDYLYAESLLLLETQCGAEVAHSIMNAFCPISAGDTIDYSSLLNYSGMDDDERFQNALRIACDLALIRTSSLNASYSIHSLLRKFICD